MIWFNGQLTSAAQMDAASAGALLGWGVFTTIAIRDGQPKFWEQHAARFKRDAVVARVELPFDASQMRAGLDELLARLELQNGLARITGTRRGDGRWNAETGADWSILAHTATAPLNTPARLEISPFRVAANAPLAGVKTTSYLPYLFAWDEARARGFDEALLLTESELICETARASIFWAKDGVLTTPNLASGCLRGVGRAIVIERFSVRERQWRLPELWEADEAFTVSAAAGVRPIGSLVDGKNSRDFGEIGAITSDITREFFELS